MSNSSFFTGSGITANQTSAIATSVTAAASSATSSASSATTSDAKAAIATTKANEAAASAAASEASKDASVVAKNAAASSLASASTQATNSANSASSAGSQANSSASSASTASGHASTATTKANEAAASAALANTKAGIATTAANSTSGSATAAASSASAANQSKINALAAELEAENAEAVALNASSIATSKAQVASEAAITATNKANQVTTNTNTSTTKANEAAASATAAASSATTSTASKNAAVAVTANFLGAHSSAPTQTAAGGSLAVGMLYFDTGSDVLKVRASGGWINAGSSINGTSARFAYTLTANQTTVTGNDAAGNALAYDSGFADVYLNGVKLAAGDFTATSGTSIVLAAGATANDILEVVAFGTFQLTNGTFAGTTTVNNLTVTGTVDGQDVAAMGSKLAGIEASATADQTNAEIRAAVAAASDSQVFTDADHSKLNAIEASATADQTKGDIEGLGIDVPAANITGTIAAARLSTAATQAESDDSTKIATTAYVVDKITTLIGGAPSTLNDLNELAAAINDDADYNSTLTTALGTKMPKAGGAFTGAVTTNSTFDGVDIATRDAVLTSTTTTANAALPKAGGTMTGTLTTTGLTVDGSANSSQAIFTGTSGRGLEISTFSVGAADEGVKLDATASGSTGQIALATNGTNRVLIDGSGNVGIDFTPKTMNANVTSSLNVGSGTVFQRTKDTYLASNLYYNASDVGKSISTGYGLAYYQDVTNGAHKWFTSSGSAGSADATHSFTTPLIIDGSGRALIGTATEGHVNADNLTISGSGHIGITLRSTNSLENNIFFSDGTSGTPEYAGYVQYNHADNSLRIGTNAAERMRITSSGNLHLGDTSNSQIVFQMLSRTDGANTIHFGDANSGNQMYNGYINYQHGSSPHLAIQVNNAERMRIDASGNLLVGKTSANIASVGHELNGNGGYASHTRAGTCLFLNRTTSDGANALFRKDNSTVGSIGCNGGDLYVANAGGVGAGLKYNSGFPNVVPCNNTGDGRDNAIDMGASGIRFDDIFATNGTIQTSDRNEKQDIAALTSAEMLVAKRISALFKTFRWKDKVAAKGDDARTHSGIIAQDVQAAFAAESLGAGDYSMFISGSWWEHDVEVAAVEADDTVEPAIEAADAYTRTDTYDTEDEAPSGSTKKTRLGIRYPELLSFLAAYNEQRFAAIETRLTALEA